MSRAAVLSDDRWARIRPPWPFSDGKRGRPLRDDRPVVEGTRCPCRCGTAWRDVPEQFGPWQAGRTRRGRCSADGPGDRVRAAFLRPGGPHRRTAPETCPSPRRTRGPTLGECPSPASVPPATAPRSPPPSSPARTTASPC
ncbi:transposase [Kocuria turfanensis]|uniref:transposase n=1 Tax=Kocuria turfanensis TaxID=388357 RepID=UPI0009FCF6ED